MTASKHKVTVSDWHEGTFLEVRGRRALFNSDEIAIAILEDGNLPFRIDVDGIRYLAYKRDASAVVPGLSLASLATILECNNEIKPSLTQLGVRDISFNTYNAEADLKVLATTINFGCQTRFEYSLDVKEYIQGKLSTDHKTKIRKAELAGLQSSLQVDVASMDTHQQLVSSNTAYMCIDGSSFGPQYFLCLVKHGSGLLMQIFENEQLLASGFLLTSQDYGYCHSLGVSERGRQVCAAHFLMDRMVEEIHNRGIQFLKLGTGTSDHCGQDHFNAGSLVKSSILLSATRRFQPSFRQKLRSMLSTRPRDVIRLVYIQVYCKNLADLSAVSEDGFRLERTNFDQLYEDTTKEPELARSLAVLCRPSPYCYTLRCEKGKLLAIGFIETNEINLQSPTNLHRLPPGVAEITHLHVLKNERGRGIGRVLVELLEIEIARMGISRAYSRVTASNIASAKVFVARGFTLQAKECLLSTALLEGKTILLNKQHL